MFQYIHCIKIFIKHPWKIIKELLTGKCGLTSKSNHKHTQIMSKCWNQTVCRQQRLTVISKYLQKTVTIVSRQEMMDIITWARNAHIFLQHQCWWLHVISQSEYRENEIKTWTERDGGGSKPSLTHETTCCTAVSTVPLVWDTGQRGG